MASYKKTIYDAMMEVGLAGRFRPVIYSGRSMTIVENGIPAATVLVWEQTAKFGLPVRNRRSYMQEKSDWMWQLFLEFPHEVISEDFEASLCETPILIPRSAELRQVSLVLSDADYEHPTRQGAVKGTNILYSFEAVISPI